MVYDDPDNPRPEHPYLAAVRHTGGPEMAEAERERLGEFDDYSREELIEYVEMGMARYVQQYEGELLAWLKRRLRRMGPDLFARETATLHPRRGALGERDNEAEYVLRKVLEREERIRLRSEPHLDAQRSIGNATRVLAFFALLGWILAIYQFTWR